MNFNKAEDGDFVVKACVPHRSHELQAAHLSASTLLIIKISIPSSENFCTYILKLFTLLNSLHIIIHYELVL